MAQIVLSSKYIMKFGGNNIRYILAGQRNNILDDAVF